MKSFSFWFYSTQAFIWNSLVRKSTYFVPEPDPIQHLGPFVIEVWKYKQFGRVGIFYGSASIAIFLYNNWNSFKNRSKWASTEMSGDFPQLLELLLLKANLADCFQSVRDAAVSRIFAKYIVKQTRRSPFKVKLCFQNVLRASLFRLV